jgi:sigma-B regulation protein RsbU (phosphoserine phosphatase)
MSKILIVDDEDNMRTIYRDFLSGAGFEVLTAGSGEEGIKTAVSQGPDLILLDVMMPGKDGAEVGRDLLDNPRTKDIPVIFLSNIVTDGEVRQAGGNIGGRIFLSKTSHPKEVIKKIKEILSAKHN